MAADGARAGDRLAAWREQGADRLDPLRFARMQALAARVHASEGKVRELLEQRLAALVEAYAADLAAQAGEADAAGNKQAEGPLAVLAQEITRRAAGVNPAYPDVPMLDSLRGFWGRLRTAGQLRHALAEEPTDAGPLNSGRLAHRAMATMRAQCPDYLRHFVAYADALASLERLCAAAMPEATPTLRESARKPARPAKPRRRKRSE